jgi:hypothetical protein
VSRLRRAGGRPVYRPAARPPARNSGMLAEPRVGGQGDSGLRAPVRDGGRGSSPPVRHARCSRVPASVRAVRLPRAPPSEAAASNSKTGLAPAACRLPLAVPERMRSGRPSREKELSQRGCDNGMSDAPFCWPCGCSPVSGVGRPMQDGGPPPSFPPLSRNATAGSASCPSMYDCITGESGCQYWWG